ncbi:hypothetical protein [Litchfieldia salsa]|uniref:Uncharacterized protein n=1 Tax=Litchfieldia salsa TaxID=930152 RepID=A0A1H0T046_9BACI|nr:hypothetical protein [Litchfieldia salsa]SDP46868.1 hypothetical protein SAMN05216565_103190 [Litchfieldia salsa]
MSQSKEDTKYDNTFKSFQNVKLDDKEKREIYLKVSESVNKSKSGKLSWHIRPVFNTILAGMLLLIGGYLLVNEIIFSEKGNQSQENEESKNPYIEIEEKISDVLQASVYIPYHEDLPLKMAMFMVSTTSTVEGEELERRYVAAVIAYSHLDSDELDTAEWDRLKEIIRPPGTEPFELVYGDFLINEKHEATIVIFNEKTIQKDLRNSVLYGEEKIIAGHPIKYRVIERELPEEETIYSFSFKMDHTIYQFTFPVEKLTEEDATAFVEKSLKQILKVEEK